MEATNAREVFAPQLNTDRCEIHKRHHPPKPLTAERHFIVPRVWQLVTEVEDPPYPGADPDGEGQLWDSRVLWLCPTGHRNVHFWMVKVMQEIARQGTDNLGMAVRKVRPLMLPAELTIATQGLRRFVSESAGSLLTLARVGEYGAA